MKIKDALATRLGPWSLGRWLGLCVVITAVVVTQSYVWPAKTNGDDLRELIRSGYIHKRVSAYVATIEKSNPAAAGVQLVRFEKGLSECAVDEANKFLASGDPYLGENADQATPLTLANRFIGACDSTKSAPTDLTSDSGGEIYLSCNLIGAEGKGFQYAFSYSPYKGTLYSADRGAEFRAELNSPTEFWGTLAKTAGDLPPAANVIGFRLNRTTGEASVSYLHKPSDAEADACVNGPKAQRIYCEDAIVLADYNQAGRCVVVDRTIK